MMKLVKLENNQFIYLDNFWRYLINAFINTNGLLRTLNSYKIYKVLFIAFILLVNNFLLNVYAQKEFMNENIDNDAAITITTTTTTSTTTFSTTTRPSRIVLTEQDAVRFHNWLDSMSTFLYELTLNYSGFININETYNKNLLDKNASFRWINFTSMIMDISNEISDYFYKKVEIVERLTAAAEDAYNNYTDTYGGVVDEWDNHYYYAKNETIFCDKRPNITRSIERLNRTTILTLNATNTTFNLINNSNETEKNIKIIKRSPIDAHDSQHIHKHAPHKHHNLNKHHMSSKHHNIMIIEKSDSDVNSNSPPSPSDTTELENEIKNIHLSEGIEVDNMPKQHYLTVEENLEALYDAEGNPVIFEEQFVLPCLERTNNEFFPKQIKLNATYSAVHVPTNVFNRDRAILRTANWTSSLDPVFRANYENDSDPFWQYFCSAHGLFRRFPAAFWDVDVEKDFFDCRVQSAYISAAASPKDVVILLDTSGSMTGLRLEIAKKLIGAIMDTLTDNDFFNIITFSDQADYLMNLPNETDYRYKLIQAGNVNKETFMQKLKYYKHTSNTAKFPTAIEKAFKLLLENNTYSCECNQLIMIITDGANETPEEVFKQYNWEQNKEYYKVRVFSFMIGRDMTDPREVEWMACANNGEFYHVATLADVNEHVHEYIPVLSRPMGLENVRETIWSNVFIGHIDKELKIAVARPCFRSYERYNASNHEIEEETHGKRDDLLLGVVGIDIPVLRLISKVSPKFQMGVGIYIIMLDNNGYIVYHPSIREEIKKKSEDDYKGKSHSVDLNNFEIPIYNEDEFEELEHQMIDQKTDNITLKNYKREGIRVIKRETEYVYTHVSNTPFSVAIASPKSFGRYYIDLPEEKESEFDRKLDELVPHITKTNIQTKIQLYNCSYSYGELIKKIIKGERDYCLDYSFKDPGQVLAIKSDLLIHHLIYDQFNFSIYSQYKNLVRSYFYGTYSGMTFYMPVTFYHNVTKTMDSNNTNQTSTASIRQINVTTANPKIPNVNFDIALGHGKKPSKGDKSNIPSGLNRPNLISTTTRRMNATNQTQFVEVAYNASVNMFTFEDTKHSFCFEKQYYTRSIEFSDYMRTEFNDTEPLVIYFLNESSNSNDAKRDTVGATLSIWLNKVPTAVTGVVYDSRQLQDIIFEDKMKCATGLCPNICSKNRASNVTCYLVDEHGVVIMSTSERSTRKEQTVGSPLYKANPWLMKSLQEANIYDLIIPGKELKDCSKPNEQENSAAFIRGLINLISTIITFMFKQISNFLIKICVFIVFSFNSKELFNTNLFQSTPIIAEARFQKGENLNDATIKKNSNCYYFGVYSLNIENAKALNASEFRTWCNNMRYLVGYLKHSNLIMVIVENEPDLTKCTKIYSEKVNETLNITNEFMFNDTLNSTYNTVDNSTYAFNETLNSTIIEEKKRFDINRYRKKPQHCYNRYPNESILLPCSSASFKFNINTVITNFLLLNVLTIFFYRLVNTT